MRLSLIFFLLILYNRPTLQEVIIEDADIGFVGNFAGISISKSPHQFETLSSNSSLIGYTDSSIYQHLSSFNGNITCSCQIQDDIYFGGYFDTVNNTISANHIIKYNMQANLFQPLLGGLDGPVYSLYCDTQSLYVGGNFSNHAIQWSFNTNNWTQLPWKGFNGPVYTITKDPRRGTILFGGRFDATMDGQFFNTNTSQQVPLDAPTSISSGNGALSKENNPSSIICPGSAPWYLQDGVPGYWDANFANPIQPTVFRLSNTKQPDRGTISFNILALGSNEYYSLAYIDPVTLQTIYCSTECVLSNTTDYQDFTVIGNKTTSNGIRININSWYGSGGGLGHVQIFQSDLAVNPYLSPNGNNSTSCAPSETQTTITGNWEQIYVYGYYRNVLEAQVTLRDLPTSNLAISYQPMIPAQGQYDIYAITPGCVGSSNCFQRTKIQYDLQLLPNTLLSVVSDQNTFSDRRTLIYSGLVAPVSDTFRPSITLRPAVNITMTDPEGTVYIMAETLEFVRNSSAPTLVSILEYNTSAPVVYNTNDSLPSAWKPLNQQLAIGSTVYTIDVDGDTLYIGGVFTNNNSSNTGLIRNIASYHHSTGQFEPLNGEQFNGKVFKVLIHNAVLYVAGEFIATASGNFTFNNVAQFDITQRVWSGLENGVDGPSMQLFIQNNTLTVAGSFYHRLSSSSQQSSLGNALYDISTQSWIERPSLLIGDIVSSVTAASPYLIAGSLRGAQSHRANAMIPNHRFVSFDDQIITAGVIWTQSKQSSLAIVAGYAPSTKITTVYIQQSSEWRAIDTFQGQVYSLATLDNRLYVGGHYTNAQSPSLTVYDLLSGTKVEGIGGVFVNGDTPGTVYVIKIHIDGKQVLVGGQFSRIGSLDCYSVCVLDPVVQQWSSLSESMSGAVFDMAVNTKQVTVVGELKIQSETAKMVHIVDNQVRVNSKIGAIPGVPVTVVNGAVNTDEDVWLLAGPLSEGDGFFVGSSRNNDVYTSLVANLGTDTEIHQLLLVPVVNSNSNENRYPNGTQNMLLAVGHLHMVDYGNASAALFDGIKWHPYLLTTQLDGQPGEIYQVIHAMDYNGLRPARNYMSIAAVILISIAISTGILFVMSALGLLFMYRQHHKQSVGPEPMPAWSAKNHQLFDTHGLFGAGAAINPTAIAGPSTSRQMDQETDLGISPTTTVVNNAPPILAAPTTDTVAKLFDTLVALAKSNHSDNVSEAQPKLFFAKYAFKAQEHGELSLQEGDTVVVTDTTDNVWWLGYKDGGEGQPIPGVFPSNYVRE